jgi:8-oxo-dGTP pyrophosphatase MutT (NUDIX family)
MIKEFTPMNYDKQRFVSRVAVYLVLVKDNQVLLTLRQNTGFADGLYSLASGHVDEGETIKHAMVREAKEEIGISIKPEDLELVHIMQHKSQYHYIDFYFECQSYHGVPANCEPLKCGDVCFFPKDKLPHNLVGNVAQALKLISIGENYSEYAI